MDVLGGVWSGWLTWVGVGAKLCKTPQITLMEHYHGIFFVELCDSSHCRLYLPHVVAFFPDADMRRVIGDRLIELGMDSARFACGCSGVWLVSIGDLPCYRPDPIWEAIKRDGGNR